MPEALVFAADSEFIEQPSDIIAEPRSVLRVVSDISLEYSRARSYVEAEEDETGKVTRPAILVEQGIMPNGQPIDVFYARGIKGEDSYRLARLALGRATCILASRNRQVL